MSQTRKRFLEKKAARRKARKRLEGMIECRGTFKGKPCGWGLYPRKDDIDTLHTCHRCATIHIMTGTGWQTTQEAKSLERMS